MCQQPVVRTLERPTEYLAGSEQSIARPGVLINDLFVNLLDMATAWRASDTEHVYEGRNRRSGEIRWTGRAVDLVSGSHSQLRAIPEIYTSDDAGAKFAADFRGGVGQGHGSGSVRAAVRRRPGAIFRPATRLSVL
jgi:hypothetical protein